MLSRLQVILATGFGFGFSPILPGTVGAVWGVPLAWAWAQIPATGPVPAWVWQLVTLALGFFVGVPLCTTAAKTLGKKDPGEVVFDEIASMPLVFFLIPVARMNEWPILLAGFVLHRVFDISKPPPCRQLEKMPEGWGIMADDYGAALYACATLHLACAAGL
jgi:phosphatidylglycerophosphatase A